MSGDIMQLISLVATPILPRLMAVLVLFLVSAAIKAELMKE